MDGEDQDQEQRQHEIRDGVSEHAHEDVQSIDDRPGMTRGEERNGY